MLDGKVRYFYSNMKAVGISTYFIAIMHCNKPQYTTKTASGKTALVCPRPTIVGLVPDVHGKPTAIQLKNSHKCPNTLDGIKVADYSRIDAAYLLYELGDGTMLLASKEAIANAKQVEHRASPHPLCFTHLVSALTFTSLAEL